MSDAIEMLERSLDATYAATKAVLALAKSQATAALDSDEWHRLPKAGARCPVSGWSRSKVNAECQRKTVRGKLVRGCRYYSLADIRQLLSKTK